MIESINIDNNNCQESCDIDFYRLIDKTVTFIDLSNSFQARLFEWIRIGSLQYNTQLKRGQQPTVFRSIAGGERKDLRTAMPRKKCQ